MYEINNDKLIVSATLICTYKLAKSNKSNTHTKKSIFGHIIYWLVKYSLYPLTSGSFSGNIWNLKTSLDEIIFRVVFAITFSSL